MNQLFPRPYTAAYCLALLCIMLMLQLTVSAQVDTVTVPKDTAEAQANDSFFLLRSKGLLRKLAHSMIHDTSSPADDPLQRIDLIYARYKGRIIRNIDIQRVDFGVPLNDTTRSFKNSLTRLADFFHHTTREYVIRNNLFFKENDTLLPILLADNERHLRDQVFLGDAKIVVKRVPGTRDSVDIVVLTKDVLSIGGKFKMSSVTKLETAVKEDNLMGMGDHLQVGTYFDQSRRSRFAYGAEYIKRNIAGSFADGYLGYLNYSPTFNTGHKQETMMYARLIKPLVNPYMKWTYAVEGAYHNTVNMYFPDSLYKMDLKYQYYNVDAWVGLNVSAHKPTAENKDDRLRTLMGIRFVHQDFQDVPQKYEEQYFYQYANLTGVLASMSIFRQDFYKTQYIYGFGRNEDVPEGIDVSLTTGWTDKQRRVRPYLGMDLQFNQFSRKKNYFNYTLRVGGYNYKKKYEDISLLFNLDFFSRLRQLGARWKQRTFVSAGFSTQINRELNEPLLLESQYGLSEYQDIHLGGDNRLTIKAESVFFNNWSLAAFRFAPFVFGNSSFLTPEGKSLGKTNFYNTVGAGLRTRNESLIFGTLEFRAYYYTRKNFNNERFRFEFNTNIKFKYNTQFIRRPEFIVVN